MIDLHCHLIPAVDDGPETMEGALALARAARDAGTQTIVATPHIDHRWNVGSSEVTAGVSTVRAALEEADIDLRVFAGGEIALPRLLELTDAEREPLRLGGGPYLLLESPHTPAAGSFDSFLLDLRRRGEEIVLAHPERSPPFHRRPERLVSLVEAGVLCSITAASLTGGFGRVVRSFALELLREGFVHNVASDSHDAARRGPDLATPLAGLTRHLPGMASQLDWLTVDVPAAILAGGALPPRPAVRRRLRDQIGRRVRAAHHARA